MKKLFYLAILFLPSLSWTQPDSLWTRCYVHLYSNACKSASQTADHGFIISGDCNTSQLMQYCCVRTDSLGNELWWSMIGTSHHDQGYSAVELTDGSVLFGGSSQYFHEGYHTAMLIKLSAGGDSLWSRTYGGESSNRFQYLLPLENNNVLIAGRNANNSAGGFDGWLVKANSEGDVEWDYNYGGEGSDYLTDIKQTNDGGFAMIGETSSFGHGRTDFFLVKTDSEGELEWMQAYGTSANDHGRSLVQTEDGGFALFGDTDSLDRGDFYLVRIDAEGEVMWSIIYPCNSGGDVGNSVLSCFDGGFLISGTQFSHIGPDNSLDFTYFRTDERGAIIWSGAMRASSSDRLQEAFHTPDGGYAMAGWSTNFPGSEQADFILHRTGPDPLVCPRLLNPAFPSIVSLNSPYPNPFNAITTLTFELPAPGKVRVAIFNQSGREVDLLTQDRFQAGRHQFIWQADDCAAGVYFCRIQAGANTQTQKLLLVR